jgi:hypothetical protein
MKTNRCFLFVAALLFGCSAAGVKTQTGSGGNGNGSGGNGSGGNGRGGSNGSGGSNNGSGGSNNGSGGGSGVVDSGLDGACAATSIGAQPVPLDLYFLMDSSKSMLEKTGANGSGATKWSAVSSALDAFFADSGSAGLGVALKYFPDEQAGVMPTCEADSDCGSYGGCDFRNTCVSGGATTTAVVPLCQTNADCGSQTCARIYDCGPGNEDDCSNGLCCAAGPSAASGACNTAVGATCTEYAGYCDKRDICASSDYATPNVPLLTLPDTSNKLSNSLSGHSPDGYTPTGPALTGAISWASQDLTTNPDHKAAVVLVTDGLPGGFVPGFPPASCTPSDIAGVSGVAMMGATASPSILTFVVGIFDPGQEATVAQSNLNMLATAGGTGTALIISVTDNNVTQELHTALMQAQTKAIACSYTIPPSSGGTGIDFTKVNVTFTSGSGQSTTIGHTTDSTACSNGGWYYDVNPNNGTPKRIIACASTCSTFQGDANGQVQIALGCNTINVP